MDRRNGGDPLAPPRPPKLQPRVHRPRAPEPTALGGGNSSNSISSNSNNSSSSSSATSTINNNNNNNNNNHIISIIPTTADFDDYQIHHLTFLPQRPSSLSRNSSNASSSTATANSSAGSSSSFTRRRPPAPLLTNNNISIHSASSNNNHNNNNNFLSHFQSAEPVSLLSTGQPPASPVTLAQPRPESERLTNEYVDTPLQHATRSQHPAGQQDNGQTTTHHLLLLPQRHQQQHQRQRLQRQRQQQRLQQQQRLPITLIDWRRRRREREREREREWERRPRRRRQQQASMAYYIRICNTYPRTTTTTTTTNRIRNGQTKTTPASKFAPPAPPRLGFAATAAAGQMQPPITKQPGSKEHMQELLQQHQLQQQQQQQQQQMLPGSGGQLGASIVMGGDPSLLNPIVCPRCGLCRCEQCQSPRPLPQTWVCNKTCLCSAESIIDYASCLCCAKALFYHCARDNDMDCDDGTGTPCVDNPCSCGPYKRTQRWGWLGALSIVLPCLWCYWPMRGCIKLCEKCYARFAGRGCRCQGNIGGDAAIGSTSSMMPIVPLAGGVLNNSSAIGSPNAALQANGKGFDHGCSAASRILRKGDLTPEKRLLDSSPDY
ncbi:LOW QUALITY PROTEIN: uncharacterized protein Dmoj_GI12961 [Drosophila mojavensis]|uniref:Protein sprouty n=1 Tax=Drosophila mojavensis TaxID=7230 RepID=B4KZK6_DROMO|nr:LOW QUALITY PROTEIN: uncharacterized protein Dmoj_GI12961 [Drosophila mojavensis]